MHSWKQHRASVDLEILNRISLAEIEQWFVAKIHSIREQGLPIQNLDIQVWHRDWKNAAPYHTQWSVHAVGKGVWNGSLDEVLRGIRDELLGHPEKRAAAKRAEARRALEEAEQIEKAAAEARKVLTTQP